jgi:hypothetical protein
VPGQGVGLVEVGDVPVAVHRGRVAVGGPASPQPGEEPLRPDITLRYFTLDRPATIQTLEGEQHARAGDWIVEGVNGELWPVPPETAREKYEPV